MGIFLGGYRNQNHPQVGQERICQQKVFCLFNDAALFADISNNVNDVTYGGKNSIMGTNGKRKRFY